MMKNTGWCLLLAACFCGCHREERVHPVQLPVAEVGVWRVEAQDEVLLEEIVGTVRPKLTAWLAAKVGGRIEEMRVSPGDQVTAGQVLVVLDEQEMQARLAQAEAVFAQATADLKRYRALLEGNAVTRAEFEAMETRQRIAEAAVAEAKAAASQTILLAPFGGVVTRKLADVGDLASAGRPLLGLEDPSQFRLEADVPEALIGNVSLGTVCPVEIGALSAKLEGVVRELAPTADASSRTFAVKLDLPSFQGLRAGLFGRVAIPAGRVRILWVPRHALMTHGQLHTVFVIHEGTSALRLVRTGRETVERVEIVSGLEEGEQMVVEGVQQLQDGQPVQVRS
jgi:RND family efflux transporter MFP subunit